MGKRRSQRPGEARRAEARTRIAAEAARLLAAQGGGNAARALRMAATRLGIDDPHALPPPAEVEAAIGRQRELLRIAGAPDWVCRRREVALDAMRFLAPFSPRLVGPVLAGTAGEHDAVTLLLHHDDEREIGAHLERQGIRYEEGARRMTLRRGEQALCTRLGFIADGACIELVLLPHDALRQPPLGRDGAPMARAGVVALEALLARAAD